MIVILIIINFIIAHFIHKVLHIKTDDYNLYY